MAGSTLLRGSALALTLLVCGGAAAQGPAPAAPLAGTEDRTEEAKALFAAGRSAFEAGRYADALGYFERCYALSQRPALLFNIALAHDRLRDDEKALAAYDAYLAAVPAAENRVEAETRAAAIREALARREQAPPPPATAAPTPLEAASTSPSTQSAPEAATAPSDVRDDGGGGLLGKWWFWTAVGAVVVGGVTIGVIAASGGDEVAAPLQPKSGVVVTTLGVAP